MKKERLTVSQFASLCGVTPRTLKYYEEAGLLAPAETAPNGYRLYDQRQLDEVSVILLFKEHGFYSGTSLPTGSRRHARAAFFTAFADRAAAERPAAAGGFRPRYARTSRKSAGARG